MIFSITNNPSHLDTIPMPEYIFRVHNATTVTAGGGSLVQQTCDECRRLKKRVSLDVTLEKNNLTELSSLSVTGTSINPTRVNDALDRTKPAV
jgi:hypothetical protein